MTGTGSLPRKCLGILQPIYLPWVGYFDQVNHVDHFVFQDDVQYTSHDWRNRNRILTNSGPLWLTVPVKRDGLETRLCDARIQYEGPWVRKQLKSIQLAYHGSPHVDLVCDILSEAFEAKPEKLVDLTMPLVATLCELLEIDTPMSRSSEIPSAPDADLTGRILEIAIAHEATDLYLGAKGVEYVDTEFLARHGVDVVFQAFEHPVYDQGRGAFVSHMSIIDFLVSAGPAAAADYFRSLPRFIAD